MSETEFTSSINVSSTISYFFFHKNQNQNLLVGLPSIHENQYCLPLLNKI